MLKHHLIAITIGIVLGIVGVKIMNRPKVDLDFERLPEDIDFTYFDAEPFPIDTGNRGIFVKGYMYPPTKNLEGEWKQ